MPRNFVADENLVKLIELVRDEPQIYDPGRKEYKDSFVLVSTWNNIADTLNVEGKTGGFWKTRWRTLRDTYVRKRRDIRFKENTSAVDTALRWKFLGMMSFLDPFLEENCADFQGAKSATIIESQPDIYTTNIFDENEGVDGIEDKHGVGSGTPGSSIEAKKMASSIRREKIRRKRTFNQGERGMPDMCNIQRSKREEPPPKEEKDEDELFFEPYALRLKKLPKPIKSIVQLQIAQLFFNAENPELPQHLITPLPHQSQYMLPSGNLP